MAPRKYETLELEGEEVTLQQYKPKEREEEASEEKITLKKKKKKPKVSEVTEEEETVTIKQEKPAVAEVEESVEEATLEIKKPVVEELPEEKEEVTLKIAKPVEEEVKDDEAEEFTIKKAKPEKPKVEEVPEETAEVSITKKKKKPKKKEEVVEEVTELTLKKHVPQVEETEPDDEATEFTLTKPAKEIPVVAQVEEVSEQVTIQRVQPETAPQEITVSTEEVTIVRKPDVEEAQVTIKKKKIKKTKSGKIEEVTEEVTIVKGPEQPSTVEIEEVTEDFVIKKEPEQEVTVEEVEEEVVIERPEKPKTVEIEEITEEVTITKEPEKPVVEEVPETAVTLKKKKPKKKEEPTEEIAEELTVKKPVVVEAEVVEEEEAVVTLKKKEPEKPVEEEVTETAVTLKKKKPKKKEEPTEEVAEELTIKKPVVVEAEVVEEEEAVVTLKKQEPEKPVEEEVVETAVTLKKKKPKKKEEPTEEVAEELTIKKPVVVEKEVVEEEEETVVTLKKQEPEKPVEEEVPETAVTLKKKKPKKKEEPTEEVAEELTIKRPVVVEKEVVEEEETVVTLKKKEPEKPVEEEVAETEVTLKKKKPKKKEVPTEEVAEELTIKKPVVVEKEVVEEEEETVVTLKKKEPEKPVEEETAEAEVTVKKKKPKKKEEPTEEVAEELTIKRPVVVEKEVVEEEEETVVTLKKKEPEKPAEEEVAETAVTLKKKKPKKKEEPTEEVAEELTIKRPVVVEKEVVEEEEETVVTLKKKEPEKPVDEEVAETEVTLKKKKPKKKEVPTEEVAEELTIKRPVVVEKEVVEEEEETVVTLKKKEPEKPVEEETAEAEITVKKKKPKKKEVPTEEVAEELTVRKEVVEEEEDIPEAVTLTRRPSKKVEPKVVEEAEDEVTIKKKKPAEKPEIQGEEHVSGEITIKRKKPRQDLEEETVFIKQEAQTYEEIEGDYKVTLKRKSREYSTEEADAELGIKIPVEVVEEPEEEEEEHVQVTLKKKKEKKPYQVEEVEEEVKIKKPKKKVISKVSEDVEESMKITIPAKPSSPAPKMPEEESVSLGITLESTVFVEREVAEEIVTEDISEGDVFFAVCSYLSDTDEAVNLVEGERVYVIEWHNSDWWFVKKHLTNESGWVPAKFLSTEANYTHYVDKKLAERIEKLPTFEKPKPGQKQSAPRFTEKLKPVSAPDGSTVQFECKVEGIPRPVITWFRQTAIIKQSQDFQIFYDDDNVATLIIREIFPEDAGTFTCVAKNACGFSSSSADLIIEAPLSLHGSDITSPSRRSLSRESSLADILEGIPPTFAQKPRTRTVDEGATVQLEYRLVAVPEPEITWLFKGKEVKETSRVSVTTQSDIHMYCTILKIKEVKLDDEGTFEITAKNREGEAVNSLVLSVVPKGVPKQGPEITQPLKSMRIPEGETVTITTHVTGMPVPKVTWYHNGLEIVPDDNHQVKRDGDKYTLTIAQTTVDDDGDYMANAENDFGTAQTSAALSVEEMQAEPPKFTKVYPGQNVTEGQPVKLQAKVTGKPTPEIVWYKNGKRMKPSKNIRTSQDGEDVTLEILEARPEKDSGEYRCVAINPAGKVSHSAPVNVGDFQIRFIKPLEDTVVEERSEVVLECETSQDATTAWYYNDTVIKSTTRVHINSGAKVHTLTIKKTEMSDTGTYKCTVEEEVTECKLTVQPPGPEFVQKLDDLEVNEREAASFVVEVTEDDATVTWHKDGEALPDDEKRYKTVAEGRVRKLIIRSASVHDEGEYTCVLGDHECTAELNVRELPPEFIHRLEDVTIPKNERAVFEIELTKGDARVRWFKDDKEIQFSEHIQLAIDGKRQRLMVYNSDFDDMGVYSCVVGDQKCTAKLKVEEPAVTFTLKLPDVVKVPVSTDAILVAKLSNPNVEVKWQKNGKPLKKSDKYQIVADGNTRKLVIKSAVPEDQAEYTCIAINVKTTTKLKVEVIETAPKINLDSNIFKVRKGEDANVVVPFSGTPSPSVEWTFASKTIKQTKRVSYTISEESASLTIKKADIPDGGNYTIKLKNNCGEASAELTLIIIDIPSKPGTPEAVDITDNSITIHWKAPTNDGNCQITNYIIEMHDHNDFEWIVVNKTYTIVETTHKVTQLVKKEEYTFRVSAVNEVGKSEPSSGTEYIVVTEPATPEAPTVIEALKDVTIEPKANLTLSCVIKGIPSPEIKWLKNGKLFKSKYLTYENNLAKYVIPSTSPESAGKYTCQASNKAGKCETSCTVKIEAKPKFNIDEDLISQRINVSGQWKVNFTVSGYPQPKLSWSKGSETIESTKHCVIYDDDDGATIAIYSLEREDSGTYTVTATNEIGTTTLDLVLRVIDDTRRRSKSVSPSKEFIDKPSKPESLQVKKVEKESVTIEWKPPADDGGLEISTYQIEKCELEKQIWMKVAEVEGDITSYAIQRLVEGAEYIFRISAANLVGRSDAAESDTVVVKSLFDKPSAPRGPFEILNMTDTSFTLKWLAPTSDGGSPIEEYLVERREVSKKAWQKVGTTEASVTSIEVTGLKKNMSYFFRVTAKNEVGPGQPYAPEESITVGKRITPPSPPTNVTVSNVTSRSVTLQWGPPASTGGAELTGYVIEKRLASSEKWQKIVTLEPSVTLHTIEKLKEKSQFVFRIFAENCIGLSEAAETEKVTLKTHASPPSPPTAPLEIRPMGSTSVLIAWGTPESDGGAPLEGYNIAVREAGKTMWMEVGKVKADIQKLNIKDLQEGHEYYIRIFARNEVGLSEPLESDEPFKVVQPTEADIIEIGKALDADKDQTPSFSFSTETTTSWMRSAGMDADIHSYSRASLLRRDEYFFRIWHYAEQLFK